MGLQLEETVPRLTLVARNDHTIRDALSDFLLARTSALRSPRTVAYYSETLRPFLAFLEAEDVTDPSLLEVRHVRAYLAKRAKNRAPAIRPRLGPRDSGLDPVLGNRWLP